MKPSGNTTPLAILDEGDPVKKLPKPAEKPVPREKKKAPPNQNDPVLKKSRATIKEVDQLLKESDELLGDIKVIY